MNDSIEQSIKSFILTEFLPGEDAANLTASDCLITTGIIDSIAALKIVLFFEREFGVTILPHEISIDHLDTIGQMVELVRSKGPGSQH
jgi:acyl carrier protein